MDADGELLSLGVTYLSLLRYINHIFSEWLAFNLLH